MKKFIIIVFAFCGCLQYVFPQISTNEQPISIQKGLGILIKDEAKGKINLLVPDIKKVLYEDSLFQEKNANNIKRTSVPIPITIDINKDGIWGTLEDGGKIWQMEVRAENAMALDFVFSQFWLPQKGKFFIFNPSTKETIGAITSQYLLGEKSNPKRFSTGIVKGDNVILEYYQPAEEKEAPVIMVEKTYYTYRDLLAFIYRDNCEVNVNCSEGSNWQNEKNAVALIYAKFSQFGGQYCAGSLLNNTQNNLIPYFLTANHNLEYDHTNYGGYIEVKDAITDNDLSDWIFYWGYEMESCTGSTLPNNMKSTTGAIVKANNSYTDFALLQLQQNPLNLSGYIPYYLGWDASGSSGTGGVCIHHPGYDVKKISTYSCTPTTVSWDPFSPYVYWGVSWIATDNGHGITEHGSSGSPLINNSHRVIGQLKGASVNLNCTNFTGTSAFGKLNVSWTGNGNSDNRRRLDYWLNPSGTNIQTIGGIYPYSVSGPSIPCDNSVYSINNLPTGFTVTWSWQNPYGLVLDSGASNESGDLRFPDDPPSLYPVLQQNTPAMNECTLNKNGNNYIKNTIVATIKRYGTPVCTLTKPVDTGQNFSGNYSQAAHQYTNWYYPGVSGGYLGSGHTIYLYRGSTITLTSSDFVGATLSYSGTNPIGWTHSGNTVTFQFSFTDINDPNSPRYTQNPASLTITGTYPNSCECFQFTVIGQIPQNYALMSGDSPDMNLNISCLSDQTYSISCGAIDNWELSVIDSATGETTHRSHVDGTEKTLNTSGWKSGIYIIKATAGKEVLTEKIQVK